MILSITLAFVMGIISTACTYAYLKDGRKGVFNVLTAPIWVTGMVIMEIWVQVDNYFNDSKKGN
jgi:1,4-dihydroxy-2-naphthoate octaprenyltransferase